jgi:glycosyltransferase involved in cell wall biosynthesis
LLGECIGSILGQSFKDFEVLVMDDCSPDDTRQVAQSFKDPRVTYIRNEQNLGHLKNYNKGIGLARGNYIWLISADDRLRSSKVLERYMAVMDRHQNVGYVFCPGIELKGSVEGNLADYSRHGNRDRVFPGRQFLERLFDCNGVLASSGMVRRSCYEELGAFELDLPYAGDWYLWCLFALHYDVGYFAEPMVNYRLHEGSMTSELMQEKAAACAREDLTVLWRIAKKIRDTGDRDTLAKCNKAIAAEYAKQLIARKYNCQCLLTVHEFRNAVAEHAYDVSEAAWIRARTYALAGDRLYHKNELLKAADFYRDALRDDPSLMSTHLKALLLRVGHGGVAIRRSAVSLRQSLARLR